MHVRLPIRNHNACTALEQEFQSRLDTCILEACLHPDLGTGLFPRGETRTENNPQFNLHKRNSSLLMKICIATCTYYYQYGHH